MTEPFTLSIEEIGGLVRQHGFHLGTDEKLARQIAEEKFQYGMAIRTVALMRKGKMVDCYDGKWQNA